MTPFNDRTILDHPNDAPADKKSHVELICHRHGGSGLLCNRWHCEGDQVEVIFDPVWTAVNRLSGGVHPLCGVQHKQIWSCSGKVAIEWT